MVSRYQEKKWTSPKATQPMHAIGEKSSTIDKSVAGARSGIPRKARKYSLEEEMFSKHMSQVGLATKSRTVMPTTCRRVCNSHILEDNFYDCHAKNSLLTAEKVQVLISFAMISH